MPSCSFWIKYYELHVPNKVFKLWHVNSSDNWLQSGRRSDICSQLFLWIETFEGCRVPMSVANFKLKLWNCNKKIKNPVWYLPTSQKNVKKKQKSATKVEER